MCATQGFWCWKRAGYRIEIVYLRLDSVQLEGRKRILAQEFQNGARVTPADRFT